MMFVMCFHMIPLAMLVPLREMGVSVFRDASCESVLWLVCTSALWLCAPLGTCLYRLYLVQSFEKQKMAYVTARLAKHAVGAGGTAVNKDGGAHSPSNAGSPVIGSPIAGISTRHLTGNGNGNGNGNGHTRGGGGGALSPPGSMEFNPSDFDKHSYSNSRMLRVTALIGLPVFIYIPVFFAVDTSTDWSVADGCMTYANTHLMIPWLVTVAWLNACGITISCLSRRPTPSASALTTTGSTSDLGIKSDAWDIRKQLRINVAYGNLCMFAFILLNALWPDVNQNYFESAYAIEIWSLLSIWQCVWRPCILTFWTKQKLLIRSKPGLNGGVTGFGWLGGSGGATKRTPRTAAAGGLSGHPQQITVMERSTGGGVGHSNGTGNGVPPMPTLLIGGSQMPEISRVGGGGSIVGPISARGAGSKQNQNHTHRPITPAGGGHSSGGGSGYGATERPTHVHTMFAHRPLMKLLSDRDGLSVFIAYTQSEFSSENVLFFTAANEFRLNPTLAAAHEIYVTFVAANSPMQVNLSSNVVRSINERLETERDLQRAALTLAGAPPSGADSARPPSPANAAGGSGGAFTARVVQTARSVGAVSGTNNSGGATTPLLTARVSGAGGGSSGGGDVSHRGISSSIGISMVTGAGAGGATVGVNSDNSSLLAVPAIAISQLNTPTAASMNVHSNGSGGGGNGGGGASAAPTQRTSPRFSYLFDDAAREIFLVRTAHISCCCYV